MKLNILKRFSTLVLCTILVFTSFPSLKTFADLEDIEFIGGAYGALLEVNYEYRHEHPDDKTVYECHHLISKEALNLWGDDICNKYGKNRYNKFITGETDYTEDLKQEWAPSITMEKADHEKTLSYCNKETRTKEQNDSANEYIHEQAARIIVEGNIIGVLKDEIDFIKETFGNKYDRAIKEVCKYIKSLEIKHVNSSTLKMRNPYRLKWHFEYRFGK